MHNRDAKVLALFIADAESHALEKASLICDLEGIREDKHYGKDPGRSVLITSTYAYELAAEQNIMMAYGALGENILTDLDLRDLVPGTEIEMGNVVIEIVQNCTLCNHLSAIDPKLPKLLKEDRGLFAKVVKEGRLHRGDAVSVVV